MNAKDELPRREFQSYRKVIADSADVVVGMDEGYSYEFANKAFLQYMGLSKAGIVGQTAPEVLGEEYFNREIKPHIDKSLRGKRTTFEISLTHSRLGKRYLHLKCYLVKVDGHRIVVVVGRDITRLRSREKALLWYRETYRIFMEKANDILLLMNPEGIITSCSKYVDTQTGLSAKDVIGHGVETMLTPASYEMVVRHLEEWRHKQAHSKNWVAELVSRDGTIIPVDIHSTPVYEGGNLKHVVVVARIIPEHKRTENELRNSCNDLEARLKELTRQYQERLRHMEEEIRLVSRRLLEAQERERNAIGRELHDEMGSYLTILRIYFGKIAKESGEKAFLEQFIQTFDEMVAYVRSLSHMLHPAILERDGLLAALEVHFSNYQRRTHIMVDFKHRGIRGRLPINIEMASYRIIQEALTNVAKHAAVEIVKVTVCQTKDILKGCVEDRGQGFDVSKVGSTAYGLSGMKDRALALGGNLVVDSSPGQGTRVTFALPIVE